MKHFSLLLGTTVGLLAPLAAHAEQTTPDANAAAHKARVKAKAKSSRLVAAADPAKKQPQRVRYEVTKMTVAGSHLPVVVYRYQGLAYTGGNSFAPRKAYRREGGSLDTTGASSVSGELLSLDPAFH